MPLGSGTFYEYPNSTVAIAPAVNAPKNLPGSFINQPLGNFTMAYWTPKLFFTSGETNWT
jgi:hypothetical protein